MSGPFKSNDPKIKAKYLRLVRAHEKAGEEMTLPEIKTIAFTPEGMK